MFRGWRRGKPRIKNLRPAARTVVRSGCKSARLFRLNVFEPDPASGAQAFPGLLDTVQETRIMLKTASV
jgi:hypothetical protein